MARAINDRDISPILEAAKQWADSCLIADDSVFSSGTLWTNGNVDKLYEAFVKRPDTGSDSFMAKLKRQLRDCSRESIHLMAEMLWALLLFPSNVRAGTKLQYVTDIWRLAGDSIPENAKGLGNHVLIGIGSGGPGFNNYRPDELAFLIELTRDLKTRSASERRLLLTNYDRFSQWIAGVPQRGKRQFRHMLRYFLFPDRVERMSSNNDRRRILEAFGIASARQTKEWPDTKLDEEILKLRSALQKTYPVEVLDFYEVPLKDRWAQDRKVKTTEGEVAVVVPEDEDDEEENVEIPALVSGPEARTSFRYQAMLAEIGAIMGFRIWLPNADRGRVKALMADHLQHALLEVLPLNYDTTTIETIKQIDVIWLRGRYVVRAFEVEHTTAVYSGLLRMADLLALQPNMNIRLHIVAPEERRDKVFIEILRPVFSLLEGAPLSKRCSFISYESISSLRALDHLAHMADSLISDFEEEAKI